MLNDREIIRQFIWRGIFGLPLVGGGLFLMFYAVRMNNPIMGGLYGGAGGFIILGGAVILAKPFARFFGELGGQLFYPERHRRETGVDFSVLNALKKKGQYEEAMEFLEETVIEFSDDARVFIEMIDLVMHELNQPERAENIYKQGLLAMETDESREILEKNYAMLTGLGQIENL